MSIVRVGMGNFWPGFDYQNNFISRTLHESRLFQVQHVRDAADYANLDLAIYSIFGKTMPNAQTPSVLFLGENQRPDYRRCTTSLSSDLNSYTGRNFYYPAWMNEIDWLSNTSDNWYNIEVNRRRDHGSTIRDWLSRREETIAIFNNQDQRRLYDVDTLRTCLPVDVFGRSSGRSFAPGMLAKLQLCQQYRFHYCTENSYWPGYLTEKILHAYLAGCIPIYDSSNDAAGLLNKRSFLDLSDFYDRPNKLAQHLLQICRDPDIAIQYLKQPLFTASFSINKISTNIINVCTKALRATSS